MLTDEKTYCFKSWVWWCMPVISGWGRRHRGGHLHTKFEASLGCIRLCLNETTKVFLKSICVWIVDRTERALCIMVTRGWVIAHMCGKTQGVHVLVSCCNNLWDGALQLYVCSKENGYSGGEMNSYYRTVPSCAWFLFSSSWAKLFILRT